MYLKSLITVCEEVKLKWRREMPTYKLTKKTFSYTFFLAFSLHFLRIHTITFSEEALKVCEHNFFQEI